MPTPLLIGLLMLGPRTTPGHAVPVSVAATERRILRRSRETPRIEVVALEDYVAAVLPSEMGNAPPAALEAQAIATRSYAVARARRHEDQGADLCDRTHCQVFRGLSAITPASRHAAQATRSLVLVQQGRVIAAPFHAVCGGHTARPRDVWDDEETPEIQPVDDDACLGATGARWEYWIPRQDLTRLGVSLGLPETHYFEVFGRGKDGRVTMVRLASEGGKSRIVRGFDFRLKASALWGWSTVRSTSFSVEESRSGYLLTGRGTGHGAGLCQAGAIARAQRGETREEILARYYRGAAVQPLSLIAGSR